MRKQSGFGLTELMIGMVVGLIIIAGVITVYMSIVKGSSDTLKSAKLNQELSAAMAIMVQDIRRAGYWGAAEPDNLNNPFMVAGTSDLNILDVSNTGDCILYTYDLNSNGSSNNEFFGFKLENGQIMMRTGNGTTTADCTDGTWLTVTDPKVITVNTLTFTTTNSKCLNSSSTASPQANWKIDSTTSTSFPCRDDTGTGYTAPAAGNILVESRQVMINLTGTLTSDNTVTKVLTDSVRVRNDRIFKK